MHSVFVKISIISKRGEKPQSVPTAGRADLFYFYPFNDADPRSIWLATWKNVRCDFHHSDSAATAAWVSTLRMAGRRFHTSLVPPSERHNRLH